MPENRHPTTRRGLIAAMGFGGVCLYGLWAAYGAAPWPLALFSHSEAGVDDEGGSGGHGGHGAAAEGSPADDFRRSASEFVERYRMPDGSVYPRRPPSEPLPEMAHDMASMPAMAHDEHAATAQAQPDAEAAPATPPAGGHGDGHGAAGADDAGAPIEVYLLAEKWFYEPSDLRLDTGVIYRFRMMAADVSHGASIQFGHGGRMIRLRPNTVTEWDASFTRPGSYLVYCTVYCGQGHDSMQARIEVI